MSKPRKLPDKETLVELRQAGLSLAEIGARYGTSRQAVFSQLRYVPTTAPVPEVQLRLVVALRAEELSWGKIGQLMGRDAKWAWRLGKRAEQQGIQ